MWPDQHCLVPFTGHHLLNSLSHSSTGQMGGVSVFGNSLLWPCESCRYERDPDALATLAAAGLHPVAADLAALDGRTLPEVDLWWASPPCQPDSTAGKRKGASDDRDGWPHLFRLLSEARRPKWLVCETVTGILPVRRARSERHHQRAARWAGILFGLRCWFGWVDYRVLDAAEHGVPQHRRRVLIVCGPSPIHWPAPTRGPGLLPFVTMREALRLTDELAIGGGRSPGWAGDTRRYSNLTDRPSTTVSAARIGNAGPFIARPDWWHRVSHPDGPSRTIGTRANASISTGEGRRRLTIAECLILQDLAEHPVQGATKASRYRQAGNAVPPRLAEVIATAIMSDPRVQHTA